MSDPGAPGAPGRGAVSEAAPATVGLLAAHGHWPPEDEEKEKNSTAALRDTAPVAIAHGRSVGAPPLWGNASRSLSDSPTPPRSLSRSSELYFNDRTLRLYAQLTEAGIAVDLPDCDQGVDVVEAGPLDSDTEGADELIFQMEQ
uniref:Uncharacterized protein n=1 Tax=Rhizochromulina marina TaxID=1034831 RepID=A0A7S2ST99_9STRA|mmetsp:Transcript_7032/g.20329  ORF Transcript_7032/g.20329 Transcript_7032/m.20329 type:complete len:144 (+) Transcript_7032:2-433(+)